MTSLEEIKRLLSAATPGPWHQNSFTPINVQDRYGLTICSMAGARAADRGDFQAELEANAQIIAKAPTLIAELVERVERLQKVADAASKLVRASHYEAFSSGPVVGSDYVFALRQALEESK